VNKLNKKGRREGYWKECWGNGNLKSKGRYINGEKEGYWKECWGMEI
jgi:antitoxin component YwqK of YwqJK toxin-antitoxin module